MTTLPGSKELHRAMSGSLNWRQPGEELVPILPHSRLSFWRRVWRWIATS